MKSEPDQFSISDLATKGQHHWDGVRSFQARNYMRDEMRRGDRVIFYHSSAKVIGASGIAEIATVAYPDHTQFDRNSQYFESRATKDSPIWFMVDVKIIKQFPRIVTREELKEERRLRNMKLWSHMRLSIIPITKEEFEVIVELSEK